MKKQLTVAEIIKQNNIKEVYSDIHGCNKSIYIDSDGDLCIPVEQTIDLCFTINGCISDDAENPKGCLIWPSKEERSWDKYQPKPILQDEYGNDLYEGDKYWWVSTEDYSETYKAYNAYSNNNCIVDKSALALPKTTKIFSSGELAKQWIEENKPKEEIVKSCNNCKNIGSVECRNCFVSTDSHFPGLGHIRLDNWELLEYDISEIDEYDAKPVLVDCPHAGKQDPVKTFAEKYLGEKVKVKESGAYIILDCVYYQIGNDNYNTPKWWKEYCTLLDGTELEF